MRWISKEPPIYAWNEHLWYNEKDKNDYICHVKTQTWKRVDNHMYTIPFTKKTRIMGNG